MTGVALNFRLGDVTQELKSLPVKYENTDKLLDNIGSYLTGEALQRFREEETPDGDKWIKSQRAKDDGGLTLTDERNLANSFTHNVENGQLEMGSDEVQAAIIHFGGKTGRNESVEFIARPLIGIGQTQSLAINNILETWGNDIVS